MIRIDANYIIRYLINDNAKMANIAEEAISTKEIFISNEVIVLTYDKKLNQCISESKNTSQYNSK